MQTFPITAPQESQAPLEQQHSARQAQLIRSTYRLIGERGVHRASLREIAQEAGMSKGLIPYYFKTKENLILATMRWALSETAERIKRAMAAAGTPEEKIVAMVDAIFVEPEANRRFHVAYLDLVGYAARVRTYMELSATFDGIVNSLNADVIRSGVAQGAFAVGDVDEAAMALRALVDGLFLQWLQEDDWRREHARYRDVCKRAALQLLGARPSAGPPRTKTPAELLPLTNLDQVHGTRRELMNAAEYLLASGADDKVAIQSWDAQITYGELRDAVGRAGASWRALGLEPGDRVLVFAPDSIDWVIAYLGAIWAGGIAVGLNSRLFERELSLILAESGARFVWCSPESIPLLERIVERISPQPTLLASEEFSDRVERATPVPAVERSATEAALWVYTSGTTGKPKAVIHAQQMVRGAAEFSADVLGVGPEARIYATSKMFFAYALGNGLCGGLGLGATVVLDHEWPTAERVAAVVARLSPTVLFTVPTLYLKMLQAGVAPLLGGMQHFVSAGEALPSRIASAWQDATGTLPVNAYGSSETLVLMLYCADESGLLTPSPRVELRLPEPAPDPGTPHRLWLRHDSVAVGYWQRPDAEREAFSDGWFSPGDLFRQRADGRWEYCGRDDDLVKISGQWVSTFDVERALALACGESVKELAALAVHNADGLTSIAVFAVPAPEGEQAASARLLAGIEALPKLKRPREVRWLDDLPRTDTGKLQRHVLREQFDRAQATFLAASSPGQPDDRLPARSGARR